MEFLLRKWRIEDAESIAAYADNPKIARNLRDAFPSPYTRRDALDYVTACAGNDETRQLCRAVEIGGRAAGSIGIFLGGDVSRKNGELGYWLAEPFGETAS